MEGYLHPLYAESFSEIGTPVYLPKSKGWLIKRQIPGTKYYDAMGPYPLFFCEHWQHLIDDLEDLREQLISVSMVIGPFNNFPMDAYEKSFDVFYPYKDHYILDTSLPVTESISKYSRRDARRALKAVWIEHKISPDIDLDEWVELYDHLIKRHNITGIRMFSRECFAKQISIPNTHYFRALHNGKVVGGNLHYIQDKVAYGHLLALTPEGYELNASYAIKWQAVQHLSDIVRWINFGGGVGEKDEKMSGLDLFKKKWTNTIEKSYFCGKIFNRNAYQQISENIKLTNWFPAYRDGDF